jgi:hypothetical protein
MKVVSTGSMITVSGGTEVSKLSIGKVTVSVVGVGVGLGPGMKPFRTDSVMLSEPLRSPLR